MTNFEAIKKMNIREMTGMLYAFLLPWVKAYDEKHKKELWQSIVKMLNSEVKEVGK